MGALAASRQTDYCAHFKLGQQTYSIKIWFILLIDKFKRLI
jgi:hypothetical protein